MPTNYNILVYEFDPAYPGTWPQYRSVMQVEVTDQNDNGTISTTFSEGDLLNGESIDSIYVGDSITVIFEDGTSDTFEGTTFYVIDAFGNQREFFSPTGSGSGTVLQNGTIVDVTYNPYPGGSLPVSDLGPPCFVAGTLISTPTGSVPVESLKPGDLVLTADAGAVPLSHVQTRSFTADALKARENICPIRISAGALGQGVPVRDLCVSPQHRVLMRSPIVERMFDVSEVLAPAVQLCRVPGIARYVPERVTYVHLIFSKHHVVWSEGAETESLLLGSQVHESLSPAELARLTKALGPESNHPVEPARLLVKGARLNNCLKRHVKNGMPLVSSEGKSVRPIEIAS